MINHNGAWLPSITIGLPALILTVLICAGVVAWCARRSVTNVRALEERGPKPYTTDHPHDHWFFGSFASVGMVLALGFGIPGFYPYAGDYHRLQPASGTVQAVDSRFLAASQYVVVTYDGGLVVRCDDSRCATVKPGEQLRLLCTKEHQFGSPLGADGWGCRWGQQ